MTVTILGIFVAASLISFLLTRSIRNIANSRGWVYAPASSRHIHKDLIPRLGGIAIFISFAVIGITLIAIPSVPGVEASLSRRTVLHILGPATLVFLLGLYDDFKPLKAHVKFAVQALAATLLFSEGSESFNCRFCSGRTHPRGWRCL